MEFTGEVVTTASRLPLMADGPVFDMSDKTPSAATKRQRQFSSTPILFDFGATQQYHRSPPVFSHNVFPMGETSSAEGAGTIQLNSAAMHMTDTEDGVNIMQGRVSQIFNHGGDQDRTFLELANLATSSAAGILAKYTNPSSLQVQGSAYFVKSSRSPSYVKQRTKAQLHQIRLPFMAVNKNGSTSRTYQLSKVRRHASWWSFVIQQTPTTAAGLRAIPDTYIQSGAADNTFQNVQMQFQQQLALMTNNSHFQLEDLVTEARQIYLNAARVMGEFTEKLVRMESARDIKYDRLFNQTEDLTLKLDEFIEVFKEKNRKKEQRLADQQAIDLGLKLACAGGKEPHFNWMFGDAVYARAGRRGNKSLAQFDKLKNTYRSNALWFTEVAEPMDLSRPFIEFMDNPRICIDGESIRALLAKEQDVSDLFAKSLVRVLRRDESTRNLKLPQGECHYVGHAWAHEVLNAGSTTEKCEALFKEPKSYYAFAGCKKVVAFVALPDGWASLSLDLKVSVASLIHPAVAHHDPNLTLQRNIGWMNCLTVAAQDHLKTLGGVEPTKKQWEFRVALVGGVPLARKDSGIAMAFYSIPKDQQFLLVSEETLLLAKHTFIHSLMRMSFAVTKQKIRKASTKTTGVKRHSNGRFKSPESDSDNEGGSGGHGGSEGDSNVPVALAI